MKKNLKKEHGFTLIEVVISIAVISIISAAIYSGYMLIIKQIQAGEVKQTAALIGKQISEEIKSVSENEVKEVTTGASVTILELTDRISVTQNQENYENISLYFNGEGNLVDSRDRYTASIKLQPKKTVSDSLINIDKFEKYNDTEVESWNFYVNNNITAENVVKIDVTKDNNGLIFSTITIGSNTPENHNFYTQKININLDLKHCTEKVTIEVNNQTSTTLNLCILNNNNVDVKNISGVLNEYYRSEAGSKIGVLYNVDIEIYDERSDESKPVFETSFVQNIDIN